MAKSRSLLPLAVLWVLGVANLFHPWLFSFDLGDIGDTRLNLFFLEHEYKVVTDHAYPGTYDTAPFWYPGNGNNNSYGYTYKGNKGNMARSDMLIGSEPLYFVPRLFFPRDQAYRAFFLIASTLNFLVFVWLCRSLGVQSTIVAGVAAWVFAFGMHKAQHLVQSQLFVEFWGTAFWGLMVRFLRSPARLPLFFGALFLGLQTLSSPYTGVFYLLGGLLFAILYAAVSDRQMLARLWRWCRQDFFGMMGAIATAAAPVIFLLSPYWRGSGAPMRTWEEISHYLADPVYWFRPVQGTLWWFFERMVSGAPGPQDIHFPGVVFLLLALGAIAFWITARSWKEDDRGRLAVVCAILSGVLILLVVRWGAGSSLWRVAYNWLPGASHIRDVRRIAIVANLVALLAGALLLDYLVSHGRKAVLYGCVGLALLENCMFLSLLPAQRWQHWNPPLKQLSFFDPRFNIYVHPRNWYSEQTAEVAGLLRDARVAYVYQDPEMIDFVHEDTVQLIGQQLDIPVINGSTATPLPGYHPRMHPREVLSKGTKFDFNGFRYLVPVAQEAELAAELRQAGLSFLRRGRWFAAYQPYAPDQHYDVEFQLLGTMPVQLKPGEEASVRVYVTNRSSYPWQSFGVNATQAGYWTLEAHTESRLGVDVSNNLPRVIFPGDSDVVAIPIHAPTAPGAYRVRLMMIQQNRQWFAPIDPAKRIEFPITVGTN